LKYIDFDKKHYFNLQAFVYKYILSLDRQYAENNPGITVKSWNCVRVAVYCVVALLLIGNCPEDRILSKALMHGTFNRGLYRTSNLRLEFSIFQHSEWIWWLQGIGKRVVMKMCTGFMLLVIRYGSGFCKLSKEASSCAAGRQNILILHNGTDVSGFQ
jgi:hypothetical protein